MARPTKIQQEVTENLQILHPEAKYFMVYVARKWKNGQLAEEIKPFHSQAFALWNPHELIWTGKTGSIYMWQTESKNQNKHIYSIREVESIRVFSKLM